VRIRRRECCLRIAEEEGERAARREEGGFLDKPTTLLRDGGGAHLRISSRLGAKVAGCGIAGASVFMVAGVASGGEEDGGLASG